MSSYYDAHLYGADRCIDGIDDSVDNFCHTAEGSPETWLSLEMAQRQQVDFVQIINRRTIDLSQCLDCLGRLGAFEIWVGDRAGVGVEGTLCATATAPAEAREPLMIACNTAPVGRFVTIYEPGASRLLNLAEVYLYAASKPPPPLSPPSWPPSPTWPPAAPGLMPHRPSILPPTPPPPPPPSSPPDDGQPFAMFTGMDWYRIGDMIAYVSLRAEHCEDEVTTCGEYHCRRWPTSLACRYLQATEAENDWATLAQIMRSSYSGAQYRPPADAVVLHARVGDVINFYGQEGRSVYDILHGPPVCFEGINGDAEHGGENRHCYVKNLAYYQEQIGRLPSFVRTVYIEAGSHLEEDFRKSSDYLRGLRDFFLSNGFVVHMRLGENPDATIAFCANARYFIQGGGGYSILLANVNTAMGGRVFS